MKHEIWTEILPQHARKVYLKHKHRGFCRLCGCDTESRYMINVLSIAAVQKFLVKIISESYGIVINLVLVYAGMRSFVVTCVLYFRLTNQ